MGKKQEKVYLCENCGEEYSKWHGKCENCGEWNTIVEHKIYVGDAQKKRSSSGKKSSVVTVSKRKKLKDVNIDEVERVDTNISELNRALSGGILPGAVILITGEPGVGKSTLLLQLAAYINSAETGVLYLSAEESINQIAARARRLGENNSELADKVDDVELLNVHSLEQCLEIMNQSESDLFILDSIQTITSENSSGIPGGLAQVKYCATQLTSAAKQLGKTLIIVGHINKQGNIAGPKILEHLVDTVLLFEGEDRTGLRLLRPKKNRFGSTEEVGIFVMGEGGLEPIDNPGEYFVKRGDEDDNLPDKGTIGSVKTVVMEGVRPIILEVQALVVSTSFAYPKRVAEGIQVSRLQLLVAVMEKFLRLNLNDYDIYINISQGFKVEDRSLDLAVIKAIYSSLKDKSVASDTIVFGEVSLSGKVIQVKSSQKREKESKRLGYSQIISPNQLRFVSDIAK